MKVYLDWIGCRLNQSEIEKIAGQFRANGHEILANPDDADLVVINTCAVTTSAASDSRQKIRQAWRSGAKEIVATGCWATMDVDSAQDLPGVSRVVLNELKERLAVEVLGQEHKENYPDPMLREPLPGSHRRTRAHIKVQDGCNNFCTFCITRLLRGPSRSIPFEQVHLDINAALRGGAREIVLSGVQLGAWGQDFSPGLHLRNLIEQILDMTSTPRLRLSSVEPWNLSQEFFSLWDDDRLCPHLHLPLQSGCAETLRRMARHNTLEEYTQIVELANCTSPDMAITTDIIVGFPGETEKEFQQSLEFVQEINFASGHVFTYSPRPLTPALRLVGEVPLKERKRRNKIMRELFAEKAIKYRERFVERELWVLWEDSQTGENGTWLLEGITGNYLRVQSTATDNLWNRESLVRLNCIIDKGLSGSILFTK
jgi:threonylcarbamoyladenosine tRNA methylthiotransferase MtaB